jgi:hypothetical protein
MPSFTEYEDVQDMLDAYMTAGKPCFPTIDWSKPIEWYDGTPAVINEDLSDSFFVEGVGDDGSAAIHLPAQIQALIDPGRTYDQGIVIDSDGTIYQEERIPMPCIRNVIAKPVDTSSMEDHPLWGSF